MPTVRTRMFDQEYEIAICSRQIDPFATEVDIIMNGVLVERKMVKPTAIREESEYLVNWLFNKYRYEFRNFTLEV